MTGEDCRAILRRGSALWCSASPGRWGMRSGGRRHLFGLVALTVFALLVTASGATAATPVTKKLTGVELVARKLGPFSLDNDPKRCVAALFAMFPNVPGAISYRVHVDGFGLSHDVDGTGPPFPNDIWKLNLPPLHPFLKVDPGHHWVLLGEYSVGSGCADALSGVERARKNFKVGASTVTVDPAKYKPPPPKKPCPTPPPGIPKTAIGRLVEIDGPPTEQNGSGGVWIQHKDGKIHRAKVYEVVYPGDLILTDAKTVVAVEMVTGGRLGINHDRLVRLGKDGERAQELPNPMIKNPEATLKKQQNAALLDRIWKKMQRRSDPLEIETAGGVFGCKG